MSSAVEVEAKNRNTPARRKESHGCIDFQEQEEDNAPRNPGQSNLIRILLSIVTSLLPERYRSKLGWGFTVTPGVIASGFVQLVGCLGFILYRYILFADFRTRSMSQAMMGAAEQGGDTAVMGAGLFILAEYMFQPVTLVLVYFAIEGLVRAAAGIISAEVVPTLPLQLLAMAHGRAAKAKHEHDLGPLIEDLVQPGAGDFALCIASCRPKPWTKMSTISYEDVFYELVREDPGPPPRRWVYVLRKRPESKIIRGEIYRYRPDELLPPATPEEAVGEAK